MTRSDIIELANQLTERKAEKVLNLNLLFSHVLQDFCGRNRYWWRRWSVTFTITAGTQTYDLTTISTTPSLSEITVEEIIKVGLILPGQNPPVSYLIPIFDEEGYIEMSQGLNPSGLAEAVAPGRYTMYAGDYKTLLFDIPDNNYTMQLVFWAMPNPNTDTTSNSVPLVPPAHHKALVSGMEQRIWETIFGPTNPKVVAAKQRYEDAIILAQSRPDFDPNANRQMIFSGDAIRST